MKTYIILKNLHIHGYHGVAPQEQLVGNDFVINLRLLADFSAAIQSDNVNDTVSYAEVYEAVKEEMKQPSKLLEHVAGRMVERLFNSFPQVEEIELSLMKRNPPMNADIETAGVEIRESRARRNVQK